MSNTNANKPETEVKEESKLKQMATEHRGKVGMGVGALLMFVVLATVGAVAKSRQSKTEA